MNTQTNTKQIQAQINTKVKIVTARHLCPYPWLFGDLKQFTNTIQAETQMHIQRQKQKVIHTKFFSNANTTTV